MICCLWNRSSIMHVLLRKWWATRHRVQRGGIVVASSTASKSLAYHLYPCMMGILLNKLISTKNMNNFMSIEHMTSMRWTLIWYKATKEFPNNVLSLNTCMKVCLVHVYRWKNTLWFSKTIFSGRILLNGKIHKRHHRMRKNERKPKKELTKHKLFKQHNIHVQLIIYIL